MSEGRRFITPRWPVPRDTRDYRPGRGIAIDPTPEQATRAIGAYLRKHYRQPWPFYGGIRYRKQSDG